MKIRIISNPKKSWAKALASEAAALLAQTKKHTVVSRGADATICIGGDGTILYANYKGRIQGTVLGIGSEKSYICQLRRDNWKEPLLSILGSEKRVPVMTVSCQLGTRTMCCLNDFVVHATHYRVAEIEVAFGQEQSVMFEGDGVIISTALGSAAYAYSAGGGKMAPTERKISIVPICPYKRVFSGRALPESASVGVTAGSDCAFIVDGIFVRRLRRGETARFGKGKDMMFFEGVGRND